MVIALVLHSIEHPPIATSRNFELKYVMTSEVNTAGKPDPQE